MPDGSPRVSVLIPCFNDGACVGEAVASIREEEPVEVVVIDDASTDPDTRRVLDDLEDQGHRVLRLHANVGVASARNAGLSLVRTPYVLPLDADDRLVAGALGKLADRLDAEPRLAACYGDYREFGERYLLRRLPPRLDPYRVVYTNKWSVTALFRREVLEAVGGWREPSGYADWDLWMSLAERGYRAESVGGVVFHYRVQTGRMMSRSRARHDEIYAVLRKRHRGLFAARSQNRRRSDLSLPLKLAYPLLNRGGRPRLPRLRDAVRRRVQIARAARS